MSARFDPAGATVADPLEAQLSRWLRGFDPGEAPVRMRVRISADLRAEPVRPSPWRVLDLGGRLASISAATILLAVVGLVSLAALAGHAVPAAGSPAPSWPDQPLPVDGQAPWTRRPDLPGLAVILAASVLIGAISLSPPVRRFARWLVGRGGAPGSLVAFPRRIGQTPRLALVLCLFAVAEAALATWTYFLAYGAGPSVGRFDLYAGLYLPMALAPAIALRYPSRDRASRWLLLGAFGLALAPLPDIGWSLTGELGWTNTSGWASTLADLTPLVARSLRALSWTSIAVGIAGRSGMTRRPGWILVSIPTAIALYLHAAYTASITQVVADNGAYFVPYAQLVDRLRLQHELIASDVIYLAWFAILWVSLFSARSGPGRTAWRLSLVAAGTQAALLACFSLTYAGVLPWLDPRVYGDLIGLSLIALLLALLVGLQPGGRTAKTGRSEPGQIPVDVELGRD
jgi:hypothetical protein